MRQPKSGILRLAIIYRNTIYDVRSGRNDDYRFVLCDVNRQLPSLRRQDSIAESLSLNVVGLIRIGFLDRDIGIVRRINGFWPRRGFRRSTKSLPWHGAPLLGISPEKSEIVSNDQAQLGRGP